MQFELCTADKTVTVSGGWAVLGLFLLVFFVSEHRKVDESNLVSETASDGVAQLRHQRHTLRRVDLAELDVTHRVRQSNVPHDEEPLPGGDQQVVRQHDEIVAIRPAHLEKIRGFRTTNTI